MADDQQNAEHGAQTCTACRGTGRLISGLGGEPHQVTCPWCQGTGVRIPGIDAQQSPAEGGGTPEGGGPPEAGS
ncbi:MAG TPA: hypothetical protein VGI07_04100 [Solirubrobacteraceae bacterium]|jgi:DnaJ-class molecular chaperone